MELPGVNIGKDPGVNGSELREFVKKVGEDLETRSGQYTSCLRRLVDKINTEQPGIALFLDRSARPIAWMLQGVKDEWRISKPSFRIPEIISISIDRNQKPDQRSIKNPLAILGYIKSDPILIVDEFSESKTGKRGVDFAETVLVNTKPGIKVVKFVFMERSEFGIPPFFYRGQTDQKDVLYFDQASTNDKHHSTIPFEEFALERTIYKNLFINFGNKFAKQEIL